MQDKDDLFERRLNDYISGMITDEEKVELFSLAGSSELYRLQYNKAVKPTYTGRTRKKKKSICHLGAFCRSCGGTDGTDFGFIHLYL